MVDVSMLVGCQLERVVKDGHSWVFSFSGGLGLRADCLWRLLVAGKVEITSEDHGQRFGLPAPVDCIDELRRLSSVSVKAATVRARTVDVTLDFGDGVTLELIATSAGYEAWVLSGRQVLVVGQPGYE